MIVADILMWFLLILGTYIVFISYWLASQALFPELADRCRQRIKAAPVKQALVGLGWTVPTAAAGIAFLNVPNPILKFVGAAVVFFLLFAGFAASSGLASATPSCLATPQARAHPRPVGLSL